jgi:hypothetical protein
VCRRHKKIRAASSISMVKRTSATKHAEIPAKNMIMHTEFRNDGCIFIISIIKLKIFL